MSAKLTAKERGLVKGAIRRVFSRSELRRSVIDEAEVKGHTDPNRPRVKRWCRCAECGELEAKTYMQADHKLPVVPVDKSLEEMTWDELVERIWCDKANLQALCPRCHKDKSRLEAKLRREHKKRKASK